MSTPSNPEKQQALPSLQSRFTLAMPQDPIQGIGMRQVNDAMYSRVLPTAVAEPKTLLWSRDVAFDLGFDEAFCSSPVFAQLMSGNQLFPGTAPFATRYGGHQFGQWAGQLGDGRAINLGELPGRNAEMLNLQLKGAGPTPYSRGADGRAVLRSSLREYLCSEAMHFLGVPTTRALSLVLTGDMVVRDMFYDGNPQKELGAIVCRVAPSFTRFGHFQLCAYRGEKDLLKELIDHTIATDFPDLLLTAKGQESGELALYLRWFEQVCRLTADMLVHWQRVGFVHGVMNTDNMSILGLTIDYGPYGWLDNYDPDWTPNTTDAQMRRYRFGQQPAIGQWNLYQLANALLTVVEDAEALQAILTDYAHYYEQENLAMMGRKLGVQLESNEVDADFLAELEAVLQLHETDMTLFYRQLCNFRPENRLSEVVAAAFYEPQSLTLDCKNRIDAWGEQLAQRIRSQGQEPEQRKAQMQKTNPCYVLRNYLAQQAIDQANLGDYQLLHELEEVIRNPYTENPRFERFSQKRPDWARDRAGCSMLSCSS